MSHTNTCFQATTFQDKLIQTQDLATYAGSSYKDKTKKKLFYLVSPFLTKNEC